VSPRNVVLHARTFRGSSHANTRLSFPTPGRGTRAADAEDPARTAARRPRHGHAGRPAQRRGHPGADLFRLRWNRLVVCWPVHSVAVFVITVAGPLVGISVRWPSQGIGM